MALCRGWAVHTDNVLGYHSTSRWQSVSPLQMRKLSLYKLKPCSPCGDWKQGLCDCVWPNSWMYGPSWRYSCSGAWGVFFLLKGPWHFWGRNPGSAGSPPGSQKLWKIYNKWELWTCSLEELNATSFGFPFPEMQVETLTLQGWWGRLK